jgi:hypothetical protein
MHNFQNNYVSYRVTDSTNYAHVGLHEQQFFFWRSCVFVKLGKSHACRSAGSSRSAVLPPVVCHALAPEPLLNPRYVQGRAAVHVGVAGDAAAGRGSVADDLHGDHRGRRRRRHQPHRGGGGLFRPDAGGLLGRRGGGGCPCHLRRFPGVEGRRRRRVLDASGALVETEIHCTFSAVGLCGVGWRHHVPDYL